MSRIRSLALIGAGMASVLALTMSPASAATTSIRSGSISGTLYAGGVTMTNLRDIRVTNSLGDTTCTSAVHSGTINPNGTNLNITSATFSGCTGGLGAVAMTAQNLPWSGGSVAYSPVAYGRDGTITIGNYTISMTVSGLNCVYSGALVGAVYNPGNPLQHLAVVINGTVTKSGGSFLCASTATVEAVYQLVGSGGEHLWVTS
ncbi:hypothetical protein [Actinomadura fibrosa]|uniref:Uncharacterized protein n=1 Tax=Actinomadura fibrosa TaxID=111802 RepID=A0ABW2XX48_9ACTN|nr:hypothetical protein [Actinomadura fibrosa]